MRTFKPVEGTGANLVIFQSGFNDEMNYVPMQNSLFSVRWAEGPEVKLTAIAIHGPIVQCLETLSEQNLGLKADIFAGEFL